MQKRTYFQTMYKRSNPIKEALLNFFFSLSSWPRMLLETVIRTRFGERYFTFSGAIVMTVVLAIYPIIATYGWHVFARYGYGQAFSMTEFIRRYFTWYGYLVLFVYMAIKRKQEINRLPGVFDFARFSLSTGYAHPKFYEVKLRGQYVNKRTIETLLEPSFFFVIGIGLWLLGQSLGSLLMFSSIFYSLSYVGAHYQGDQYLMDKIDERILNEDLGKAFIDDQNSSQTRGFSFMGRRPADPDTRRKMADLLTANEDIAEAV